MSWRRGKTGACEDEAREKDTMLINQVIMREEKM
jgi:hypothetical protein